MNTSPANIWNLITPSDVTVLASIRTLFIGGAGVVVLEDANGNTESFTVQDGQILPVAPMKVLATGTTATNIIGLI